MHPTYEAVIGLEVHAQLLTDSKLFCGDAVSFGAGPNTHVSPITLGHPGTLPFLNRRALEHAVRLGLACSCSITRQGHFARKNYFYPDLPKGYQISQHEGPICVGGHVDIRMGETVKRIRLTRIHLEEDAGKSLHDVLPDGTCLDFNRAGTALLEIVTEPDIRSAEEAHAFLTEVRRLVRWLGVCDGNMEEGSLRCDANISIRPHGQQRLGTRVEVKNLNSMRHVRKAVESELARQSALLAAGTPIRQETRSFDADDGGTFPIRGKEDAEDYRYFPEPDLAPFMLSEDFLESAAAALPELPEALVRRLTEAFGLPEYDARQIAEERDLAEYFLDRLPDAGQAKAMANWLLGPVRSWINENGGGWPQLSIDREAWAALLQLTASGQLSFSTASHRLLPMLLEGRASDPVALAKELDLLQDADAEDIVRWVDAALEALPEKVLEYRKGKKGLIGLFMGEVRKRSAGKADPRRTQELLQQRLDKSTP